NAHGLALPSRVRRPWPVGPLGDVSQDEKDANCRSVALDVAEKPTSHDLESLTLHHLIPRVVNWHFTLPGAHWSELERQTGVVSPPGGTASTAPAAPGGWRSAPPSGGRVRGIRRGG